MKSLILLLLSIIPNVGNTQKILDWKLKSSVSASERKTILTTVKNEVEVEIKQKMAFTVRHLKVSNNYAWLEVDATKTDGRHLNFIDDSYDCCHVEALLQKKNGKWEIIVYGAFSTDCWYCGISLNYPEIPVGIFSESATGHLEGE